MKIGIPRETKEGERRVGLAPAHVAALVREGNDVAVETSAGHGIGEDDADYGSAGARIVDAGEAWGDLGLFPSSSRPASKRGHGFEARRIPLISRSQPPLPIS